MVRDGHKIKSKEQIKNVLEIYVKSGPINADNALDVIQADLNKSGLRVGRDLTELQFIIRNELGQPLPSETDNDLRSPMQIDTISQAICGISNLIRCRAHSREKIPSLVRAILAFNEREPDALPKTWLDIVGKSLPWRDLRHSISRKGSRELTAREHWISVLRSDPSAPTVMSDILRMIGIEEVKAAFISQYHRVTVARDQGDISAFSYNACFEGNPGTGKTTVARHYRDFLKQLGVLPKESTFVETSGSSLSYNGMQFLENALAKLKSAKGGVIFIDEAYQLLLNKEGLQVLDFLLPLSEGLDSKYGSIVWIFAGYSKDMEKLMAHNIGLSSRFPVRFVFKDYNDEELMEIFKSLLIHVHSPPAETGDNRDGKQSIQVGRETMLSSLELEDLDLTRTSKVGDSKRDRFGNLWTFDGKLWRDSFGNCTGIGPRTVGSLSNRLITQDLIAWSYSSKKRRWESSTMEISDLYPGDPQNSHQTSKRRRVPFQCEDERYVRVAMRRLGRQRGRAGFGNARAVQTYFDQVRSRQAERIKRQTGEGKKPDLFLFIRDDILGPRVTEAKIKSCKAYNELQRLEGLLSLKESVDNMISLAVNNARREEEEKPVLDIVINRIFLGNPGTGKTTVARLYGKLLVEMGLLSKGRVLLKTPSDFVGDVVGSSEKNTREILRASEGCVLVIDEAYALYSGTEVGAANVSYNTAVINTLVEQIQAVPGEDRAVLLLGYQDEMENMLRNVNPGLSRRFQLEFAFQFPDYDDEALMRIFMAKVERDKLKIDFQVAKLAVASLAKARAKPHFGNAGAVENMLSEAKVRSRSSEGVLVLSDFGLEDEGPKEEELQILFQDLVGCEDIKSKIWQLRETVNFARGRGDDPRAHVSYHYLFLGNSGTGKTTVAMRMGKLFKAMGLLPDDTVHCITPSDFLTGYAGQTSKKTREVLLRSRGAVLLIDEAYQLDPKQGGSFMTEAVDELVRSLTAPEFSGKLLVILAGYRTQVEQMLLCNQGLKSRFNERFAFLDMNAQDAARLMEHKMSIRRLPVQDADLEGLSALAEHLVTSSGFANGRDVDLWSARTYQEVSQADAGRVHGKRRTHSRLCELRSALGKILEERKVMGSEVKQAVVTVDPNTQAQSQRILQPSAQCRQQEAGSARTATRAACDEQEFASELTETIPKEVALPTAKHNPFAGLGSPVLAELQAFLDENGLNTSDAVARLSVASMDDATVKGMIARLSKRLSMSRQEAEAQVEAWKNGQAAHQRQLETEAERTKESGVQAIWRCAVCGRDDKPWIACSVAPYIVRYERVAI